MSQRQTGDSDMTELISRVNSDKRAVLSLKIISHASALIVAVIYAVMVVRSFFDEPSRAVVLLLFSALAFALVSLVRKIIDAPRPYESEDFSGDAPQKKSGSSFPSRHVFSAFIIGTAGLSVSVPLGISALVLGAVIGACRVLLYIHHVRDCIAGATLGAVLGALELLVILI